MLKNFEITDNNILNIPYKKGLCNDKIESTIKLIKKAVINKWEKILKINY